MVPDSNILTSTGVMAQEEMSVDFHTLLAKKDKVKKGIQDSNCIYIESAFTK